MTIAFAVPFYSGAAYLEKALQSILAQTHADFSVWLVDDNPESGEARAVFSRFADDRRFHYAPNPKNLGIAGAWNRCLEVADRPLVTLVHSDDELAPNYAATMLALANEQPEATAYFCRAQIIDENGFPVVTAADRYKDLISPLSYADRVVLRGDAGVAALALGNFIICPTLCYRRSSLGTQRFETQWKFVLDWAFSSALLEAGLSLVGTNVLAYRYRRHAASTTASVTKSGARFDEELAMRDHFIALSEARGWWRTRLVAKLSPTPWLSLGHTILSEARHGELKAALSKLRRFLV